MKAANSMFKQQDGYFEVYLSDKNDSRPEDTHQVNAMAIMRAHYPDVAACHIVNEGLIPVQYREKLRMKGLEKGASDIQINCRSHDGRFGFAAVELKRATKAISSPVSGEQRAWLRKCAAGGGFAVVCYGYKSFLAFVKWYLDGIS